MKPGFCYVSENKQVGTSLTDVIESLAQVGVTLRHPTLNRTIRVLPDGDTEDTDLERLMQLSESGAVVPLFWLDPDTSLIVSFHRLAPGLSRHRYMLDGLDAGQRALIQAWTIGHFKHIAAAGLAQMLIVDPVGETIDVDWDAVAEANDTPPSLRFAPAVVGIPSSWRSHWRFMQEMNEEAVYGFTLLSRVS